MKNNIIAILVTLTISVILAGSLLVPVINDMTDHSVKYTNAPAGESYIFAEGDVTFAWDGTSFAINDVETTPLNKNYTTVTSDNFLIRSTDNGFDIALVGTPTWTAYAMTEFSITASNGAVTGTYSTSSNTDVPISTTYETLYYQDTNGDYVMTSGSTNFFLKGDTEILVDGFNTSIGGSGGGRFFKVTGSIDEGFTMTTGSGNTYTDYTLNATKISGVDNAYNVTSIVFTNVNNVDVTLNRLIVPMTIETTEVGTEQFDSLITVIPVMVIVMLLMGAVGALALRGRD